MAERADDDDWYGWFGGEEGSFHVWGKAWVAENGCEVFVLGEGVVGFADQDGDMVASSERLLEDKATCATCCADEEDLWEHNDGVELGVKNGCTLGEWMEMGFFQLVR